MIGNGHVSQACLWSETRYVQCFVCLELFLLSKLCGSMWTLTTHDGSNISTHQKRLLTCSRPCAPRSAAMPGNWNTVFSTCCESRSPATGLLFGKRGVAGSHRLVVPYRTWDSKDFELFEWKDRINIEKKNKHMFRSKLRYLWTWFMDRNHFFKNIRVFSKYAPFYASSFSGSSSSDVSPHCNTPLCLTRCASPLWVPAVVVLWLHRGFWGRSPWAKTYGVTLTRARALAERLSGSDLGDPIQ